MSAGRALLRGVAVVTAAGGFVADWNRTHLFNPRWPPHARFHDAQTIALGALLGGSGLYLLRRSASDLEVALGAVLPGMFWASMGASFAFPGTGGLEAEFPDRVPQVAGVWLNERVGSALMLAASGTGYALEERRRRR